MINSYSGKHSDTYYNGITSVLSKFYERYSDFLEDEDKEANADEIDTFLYHLIVYVLINSDNFISDYDFIVETFNNIKNAEIIKKEFCLDNALTEALIRNEWEIALNSVDFGRELSSRIGFSFYDSDISKLAKIYKSSDDDIKTKIIDLLEDCNFHYEANKLSEGFVDKYIKGK